MLRKKKYVLWGHLLRWQKFIKWTKSKETPAKTFRKSSRYADLKRIIREVLNKFRLQRLPKSVWLYLRRNGRLHTHQKQSADEQRNETQQSNPTETENTEYRVPQLYICDMVRCYSITVYQEVNNSMTSVASEIHTVSVSAGSNIIIINSYVSTMGKRILIGLISLTFNAGQHVIKIISANTHINMEAHYQGKRRTASTSDSNASNYKNYSLI
jgi:hypothetical protein